MLRRRAQRMMPARLRVVRTVFAKPTPPVIARKAVGMRFIDGQPDARMRNGANFTAFLPELTSPFDEKIGSHK